MSSGSVLIDLHYLPCIEYFALFLKYDQIRIESCEYYQKQSYRNRCYVLTANKVVALAVPVVKGNRKQLVRDIQIDYNQRWKSDHWRTIESAYGKSPFFAYYADFFAQIIHRDYKYLFDLNWDLLTKCLSLLRIDKKIIFTSVYEKYPDIGSDDLRSAIHPKKSLAASNIYQPVEYMQNFGSNFVPNLSIVDLLFCEGTNAPNIVRQSLLS
jgi:hypothetical protein